MDSRCHVPDREFVTGGDDGGAPFRPMRRALGLLWFALRYHLYVLWHVRARRLGTSLFIAWAIAGASLGIAITVLCLVLWRGSIQSILFAVG